VLPKYRTAIFVHGCFWHRHAGCRYAYTPKNRADFWEKKFKATVERDKKKADELHAAGWRVIVVWECDLKMNAQAVIHEICEELKGEQYGP
jgi:DNA mismatch endonuclease (patch repair protein)